MPNKILFFCLLAILLCACADSNTDADANNQVAKQLHPWLKGVGRTEDLTLVELILRSEHKGIEIQSKEFLAATQQLQAQKPTHCSKAK